MHIDNRHRKVSFVLSILSIGFGVCLCTHDIECGPSISRLSILMSAKDANLFLLTMSLLSKSTQNFLVCKNEYLLVLDGPLKINHNLEKRSAHLCAKVKLIDHWQISADVIYRRMVFALASKYKLFILLLHAKMDVVYNLAIDNWKMNSTAIEWSYLLCFVYRSYPLRFVYKFVSKIIDSPNRVGGLFVTFYTFVTFRMPNFASSTMHI